ncbi:MAG: HAD family hydrolase [Oscillatoriales cyanobacterium]|nr:MAG: HAD family hydrolase [Oscillatoriales cyanobacterium]
MVLSGTTTQPLPPVIFLDAVGTIFGVAESVGQQYARMAAQLFDLSLDDQALNQAFFDCFGAADPCVFPGVPRDRLAQAEYDWWETLAEQTFQRAGLFEQIPDFATYFAALYDRFATAAPWFVYDEVHDTLSHWRATGIELGIISNFDTRLYRVLDALDLTRYFKSFTLSTEVGAAKPDRAVFAAALAQHRCAPHEAWHIGDSLEDDYRGATAAGLRALWLNRP